MGVVLIGMNSLRVGGSQTYALTLIRILSESGLRPVVVAKPGRLSAEFARLCPVIHTRWREGAADVHRPRSTEYGLRVFEADTRRKLRRLSVDAALASQPFPTSYLARFMQVEVPGCPSFGLVHGTTSVEFPPHDPAVTTGSIAHWFTATRESHDLLSGQGLPVTHVGNLFRGAEYWRGLRPVPSRVRSHLCVRILFSGTLTPNKTAPLDALLRVVSADSNLRLSIAGDGPERLRIAAQVSELGLTTRVTFMGHVLDMRPAIDANDVLIGVGRAAIEGASKGMPVIVANSDGIHGLLRETNFKIAEDANFTGRSTVSQPVSERALRSALSEAIIDISSDELAELQARVWRLGDPEPLVRALGGLR